MTDPLDTLIAQWTRLGAGFNAEPSAKTPDLERLLLDTARHAAQMSRIFIMAATWLNRYGDLIAKNRLKRLIRDELPPEHRPTLGLLLDTAQQGTHPLRFQSIIANLTPASSARPLFIIEASNERLAARAQRQASPLSKKWGLWCAPFEFKNDALRPPHWLMSQNPSLRSRADFRGDLRSSILASLQYDTDAGKSELHLARTSGGSRTQVRNSLDNLELTGRVARTPDPSKRSIRVSLLQQA